MTSFLCVAQIGLEPIPQPQSAQRRYSRLCLFRLRKASMKFPPLAVIDAFPPHPEYHRFETFQYIRKQTRLGSVFVCGSNRTRTYDTPGMNRML